MCVVITGYVDLCVPIFLAGVMCNGQKAIQCTLIIFSCTQVRYILLAAPYRQEFIFSAYSVPCTSPQCLVWFQLWSSMAKQVLKSNVSGFISKFLTVISISLLACQCLDVKVQVPCHLHLTQTGSLGVCVIHECTIVLLVGITQPKLFCTSKVHIRCAIPIEVQ